jgi:hypothetical protein
LLLAEGTGEHQLLPGAVDAPLGSLLFLSMAVLIAAAAGRPNTGHSVVSNELVSITA